MAGSIKASKRACCLIFGKNDLFLKSLLTDLCGGNDVTDVQLSADGQALSAITCEAEIDSKYHFLRLRFVATNDLGALQSPDFLKNLCQSANDSVTPVCCIIICHSTEDAVIEESEFLNSLKKIIESLNSTWTPEARILLSVPSFPELENYNVPLHNEIAKFCAKSQIELVDMEPASSDLDSFCEDGRESEEYGVKRILSALSVAAAFASDARASSSPQFHRLSSSSSTSSITNSDANDNSKPQDSAAVQTSQNGEFDNFDALFSRLITMKERCQAIPEGEDRHAYAERVVSAFWKAIGGEDDELDSSSSGSSSHSSSGSVSDVNDDAGESLFTSQNNS